jgi:methyl-accepting chemotaxis protein
MDEMTQQNAALAEQSAASAVSLDDQIGRLNSLVATFRTGPRTARPTRPRPVAAYPSRERQPSHGAAGFRGQGGQHRRVIRYGEAQSPAILIC